MAFVAGILGAGRGDVDRRVAVELTGSDRFVVGLLVVTAVQPVIGRRHALGDVEVEAEIDREQRGGHAVAIDLAADLVRHRLGIEQFEEEVFDVAGRNHVRGLDHLAAGQLDPGHPVPVAILLGQDPADLGVGAHPATVGVDQVDQVAGKFLAATPHVEGAFLQVVVDHTGVQ